MRVGFLHLGSPEAGVARYGRVVAAALARRPGVEVVEHHADFDRDAMPGALRACLQAARRLRGADAVVVPYTRHVWGGRRLRAAQAVLLHLALRRRTLVVLHDVYETGPERRRFERPDAERLALSAHLRLAGGVAVHGEHERDRLRGLPRSCDVNVIPHFVERRELPDRDEARAALGVEPGEYVVSVLGFIHPRKGHGLLIEALAGMDLGVKLWFLGSPAPGAEDSAAELEARARELGLGSRVTFTGYLPEDELERRLAATDLAACPYADVSASGSLSTWIGARRPVLATDLPATRELRDAAPDALGLLPERTPAALHTAINGARLDGPPPAEAFEPLLGERSVERTAERYAAALPAEPRAPAAGGRSLDVAVTLGSLAAALRRRLLGGRRRRRAVLIPSAAPGSSGDEALVRSSLDGLRARGGSPEVLIAEYPGGRWADRAPADGSIDLSRWWGRGELRGLVPAALRLGWQLGAAHEAYLIGADVLDGAYSDEGSVKRLALLDLAARGGTAGTVLGSSWNEHPAPGALARARRLDERVRWCARDPRSAERLRRDTGRRVELTADTAFLLEPERSAEAVRAISFAGDRRQAGRTVLGVNLNPLALPEGGAGAAARACARAVTEAVDEGCAVVLLPHDDRGDPSDLSLARDVHAQLSDVAAEHTLLPSRVLGAREMKGVLGSLDGVVAGRMHVGIGALSQAVPTRLADIQGKVAGLYEHLGLEGGTYSVDALLAGATFAPVLRDLAERRHEERAALERRLPEIQRLARANFGAADPPRPERPRVVFVTDIVTPYMTAVFEALARMARLKVIFCAETGSRGTDWERGELPFEHELLSGPSIPRGSPNGTDYYPDPRIGAAIARARPDAIVSAGWSIPTLYATLVARARRIPLLIQSDGTGHSERRMNPLQRWSRRVLVPVADGAVANSELSARRFEELGFDRDQVFRAPHATRIDQFLAVGARRPSRAAGEPLKVLHVGRLIPRKGVDRLLAATAGARAAGEDVRLLLAGSGPEEEALRRRAAALGLDGAVEWRGFVQQDELPGLYAEAHAFAFPTFRDPFGIVMIEAAAAGLPLLGSPYGGATADLVVEGETGFVLDPEDVRAWTDALLTISKDPALGARMGESARARAAGRTPENAARGYMDAVEASLERRVAA
jgi:colanic acid/amylovoran biosynthesis protein